MNADKASIMVVDDEPEIVNALKHFLSAKGYNVIGASSGEDALNILEKEKKDLILLDVMMPGIKGTEVARIVKEKYPSVKVIIVTAYPDEGQDLLKEKKLESILVKPVKIQELYNKLSEVLNPEQGHLVSAKDAQNIRARVLLIKAKLLFMDSNLDTYNFLKTYLKGLSSKGENYDMEVVVNEEEFIEKITSFNPDILVVNSGFLQQKNSSLNLLAGGKYSAAKETIVYNISGSNIVDRDEFERLVKAIEVSCFRNGLMEIKWIEL